MLFNAIVHAPTLRPGARLNIAEADQVEGKAPEQIAVGSDIRLRFGVCCPDLSVGRIVSEAVDLSSIVLAIDDRSWTLLRGGQGVSAPGISSENWYVAD